jgi:ribosome-associated translation inhibitor RaiA
MQWLDSPPGGAMTSIKIERAGEVASPALRGYVTSQLASLIERLRLRPTHVRATFVDENGPKGGRAMRCALDVRLPRRSTVHVEATATTPRLAFDGAHGKLARQLTRLRDLRRELRRRPKKYYVAKRALASQTSSPT